MVSSPSDSGVTSSSSVSPPPVSASACKAAPSATTSSGSMSVSGGLPIILATSARTSGTRVEPPTSTTPCTSAGVMPASRQHIAGDVDACA